MPALACRGTNAETAHGNAPASSTPRTGSTGNARAAASASSGNDDGEWVRAARDFANTRYSPLNQITSGNVNQLRVAWTFSTGTDRGQEGAPLVVGDTMYVVTPYPNILYALDLTQAGCAAEVELRAGAEAVARRAWPAATS